MLLIYVIAFFSGLAVMGIELSASRLIAPYFGTSLFVWTNVIAVIMIALSVGYYLGGKMSEKSSELGILNRIILTAGIFLAFIPFVVKPLATFFVIDFLSISSVASFVIILGSFVLTIALFFIPIMLLGMVSPFLIKIVSLRRNDIGNVAGHIFAISTVGSIFGTFLPAMIFIPLIGTKLTILVFSSILIILGLIGFARKKIFVFMPLALIAFGSLDTNLRDGSSIIAEAESPYQYIQVVGTEDGTRYFVYNEGGAFQSKYNPSNVFSGGAYYDAAVLTPALNNGKKVLIVGLSGGTISRAMQEVYGDDPEFHMTGIEIDPRVIELGKKFFELEQPDLEIKNLDGRNFLDFKQNQYDVVFIDAYTNQLYIPFHLTTHEFFSTVRNRLSGNGILSININASSVDSKLLRAISNTVAKIFPYVYRRHVGSSWNYMVYASPRPLDFVALGNVSLSNSDFNNYAREFYYDIERVIFNEKELVLTDDLSPVEHLTDIMIWDFIVKKWKGIDTDQIL